VVVAGSAPRNHPPRSDPPRGKERVTERGPVECAHSLSMASQHTTPCPGCLGSRPPRRSELNGEGRRPGTRDSSSRISPRIARNNRSGGAVRPEAGRRSPTGRGLDCNWYAEPFADSGECSIRWHAWLKPRNKRTILAGSTRYRSDERKEGKGKLSRRWSEGWIEPHLPLCTVLRLPYPPTRHPSLPDYPPTKSLVRRL